MTDEDEIRAAEKALGEPFGLEFSDDVLKTRRNLLLVGALSVVVTFAGLTWREVPSGEGAIPYFGVPLKGMTNELFQWLLLMANLYLLVHFLWAAWDGWQEYLLRRTGMRANFQTIGTWAGMNSDHPSDPRQSTLYGWWLQEARGLSKIKLPMDDIEGAIKNFQTSLGNYQPQDISLVGLGTELVQTNKKAVEAFSALKDRVQHVEKIIDSPRLVASLKRFDEAFSRRALSQCWRWLILEFGLPALLGLAGVSGLAYRLASFYFSS